nr:hypothetical protein [Tanacetum cinerariifolium]
MRGGGGRGVKKKHNGLGNDTTKEKQHGHVASSTVYEPVFSSLDGPTVAKVFTSGNKSDTQEGSVGQSTDASNEGNVLFNVSNSSATPSSGSKLSWPTSYAKNGVDVAILLESVRANNPFILKKWDPKVNLIKEDVGSVSVWVKLHGVPMTAFREGGLSVIATKLGTHLMLESYTSDMCMHSWVKQVYKPVSNKNSANISGKMKRVEVPIKEVSISNLFDVLNFLDNDDDLGTNEGNSNSAEKGSLHVAHGSSSNGHFTYNINKIARQILDGKLMFVNDDRNPLVPTSNVDSESEVEVVVDKTANLIASTSFKGGSDRCYGTNSLLKQ